MAGLEFVDGLMDATQPVCQVIELIEPLLLVKEELVGWVGICGWIDGCYTTRLPGHRADRATFAGKGGASCLGWNLWMD